MSYPPLPSPAIQDAPNVPGDLGRVANAIETQALSQYGAYNTSGTPSASSIETRLTAIDDPSTGTAQALDARVTTLNTAISTWTAPTGSNLATQISRTSAYPARQTVHDSTMSSLNSQLAGYEPSISALQSQLPQGIVATATVPDRMQVSTIGPMAEITFTARSNAYYRVIYTGTYLNQGTAYPTLHVSFVMNPGPPTGALGGNLLGASNPSIPTLGSFPFSLVGLTWGISGQYTISFVAYIESSTMQAGLLTGKQFLYLEDLGP